VRAVLAVVLAALGASQAAADDADLLFPSGAGSARVRLELTSGGESPERAWSAFLDRLFDYFDRNGDGFLSPADANRVFPLPLSGSREVAMDFAALDTDRDGKGSRAEFRAFYRKRGFTPVVVVSKPAPPEALALGEALFRHLDRDGDGKLTAAELRQAVALLRRFDEDEDEVLTAAELLAPFSLGSSLKPAGLQIALAKEKASDAVTLRLPIGAGRPSLSESNTLQLSPDGSHLRVPGGICTVTVTTDDPLAGFRTARGFYLAQFKAAVGERADAKKVFEEDPAASVLAGLFRCQVVVTAIDRGRNLFDLIDANADGRLDLGELTRASRMLPDSLARVKPLDRASVPASYRLIVSRGPVADSFGPVPFGSAPKRKATPAPAAIRGPGWFRAMDRNGDGYVSRQEFIGPPELFTKLDTDGDGRISPEEAERAGRP
jgi:Ca2+-binding EF-hand superfamily protein